MAHRVEDDTVRAAIRIDIDPHWHLYHEELGWPDSIGKPTVVDLQGEGVTWGPVLFPEPKTLTQAGLGKGGRDTFIYGHDGRIVLYATGVVTGELSGIGANLSGLTCEDGGSCVPYSQKVKSKLGGADELFANFPATVSAPGSASEPPAEGPEDEYDSGEADATLYARVDGDLVHVALEIDITPKWHLYDQDLGSDDAVGLPTEVELIADDVIWSDVVFPKPHVAVQRGLGKGGRDTTINEHSGKIVVKATGVIDGEAFDLSALEVRVDGQTCDVGGMCIPYGETAYYRGPGKDALFADMPAVPTFASGGAPASNVAGDVSRSDPESGAGTSPTEKEKEENEENEEDDGLLAFLGLAVFWGLFTLLMPCTYPMIPITISYFTKQGEKRGGSALPLSLAYGAGIVLIFVLIGVIVGAPIIRFASHPITNLIIGVAFVYFSLVLFGIINLQPPQALMNLAGKASQKGGYLGVFLMGATLVVTSFTCTAPFVGSLLAAGAESADPFRVALGMAVFGGTIAIPFVFLSLVPGKLKSMPRSGEWMHTLKVTLGFVELAAALKFLSNADLAAGTQALSRELFLMSWAVIFVVAGLYLLGFIKMQEESGDGISPGRMLAGVVFMLFSGYMVMGFLGFRMDPVMSATVPNYSTPLIPDAPLGGSRGGGGEDRPVIVKDDFDGAVSLAREKKKALLVNFTGVT